MKKIDLCNLFNGNQYYIQGKNICYLSVPLLLNELKRFGFEIENINPQEDYMWIIDVIERKDKTVKAKAGINITVSIKFKEEEILAEGVGVYLVTFREGYATSEEGTCIIKLKEEGIISKEFLQDESWIKAFYL
ncbi:MAG: hypothetical protein OWQ54_05070 [Sulfolobaceae archaeon]|nr:hypothetical protein [Sulfolobaceae archaeon]